MKKNKLLTLGFALPTLAAALVPAVSCGNKAKEPTIVEQENITVTIDSFELNKDLVLSYKLTSGYVIDKTKTEIKVDDTEVSSSKIDYQDTNKKVVVDASVVTSSNISIKLCAKNDVGVELVFDYDPEKTWFAYDEGDKLDFNGITVTEVFESGEQKVIDQSKWAATTTPSKDKQLTIDDDEVVISYDGLSCSYPIFVTQNDTSSMFLNHYQNILSRYPAAWHEWKDLTVYGTYNGKTATDSEMIGDPKEMKLIFGTATNYLTMYGGKKYSADGLAAYLAKMEQSHQISYYNGKSGFLCYKIFNGDDLLEEVIFQYDGFIEYYYEKGKTSNSGVIVLYE